MLASGPCRQRAGSRDLRPSPFLPDELFAVEAEGGLTQEGRHEFVPIDLVDPAPHGTLSLPRELFVGFLFHCGFICQGKSRTEFQEQNPASQEPKTVWALGREGQFYIYNKGIIATLIHICIHLIIELY